jgi:hypothetical protein
MRTKVTGIKIDETINAADLKRKIGSEIDKRRDTGLRDADLKLEAKVEKKKKHTPPKPH